MSMTIMQEADPNARQSAASPAPAASASFPQLAVYGGPKAAPLKFRERWRPNRLLDLLPIVPYLLRGKNTLVSGGPITRFEDRFAQLTDTRYAILMNSGTATLYSAYVAAGIKPGDEVLVPTYTWFATITPILQCGGTPVFCDIDPRTLTMDPEDAERRITDKTKAICVVHIWGNPAALDRYADLARRYNLILIEDASHAHGATFQGRPVGSWGDISCFSLQGTKAVTGGEAGVVVTNNPTYYDRMLALGHNFRRSDHVTDSIDVDEMCLGVKFRPHLCAAMLASASLERLGKLNRLRKKNYEILERELADCPALETIGAHEGAVKGGYLEFPIRYRPEEAGGWPREAFVQASRAEGVVVSVDRYTCMSPVSQLLHRTPLFNTLDLSQFGGGLSAVHFDRPPSQVQLPVAERLAQELLSLHPFTSVSEQFVRQQARGMCKVVDAARRIRDFRTGL